MSKTFSFIIDLNNYRSGSYILTLDNEKEEEPIPDEAVEYSFSLPPINKYRLFIVAESPFYKIIDSFDTNSIQEAQNLYLKMFSQIYNCLPFKTTDYTSSYKEIGNYQLVDPNIKNIPNIKIIDKITEENTGDHVYFVFVVDSDGTELFTELL